MRATINSVKHIRQVPIDTTTGGAVKIIKLVESVEIPAGATADVRQGAVVKAIYIELWLQSVDTTVGSQTTMLEKVSGGQPDATFAQMAALHDYPNKKNVFYITQGLTAEFGANPVAILRTWVKIPKGKQRFGLGDKLQLTLSANLQGLKHCGLAIFKEYY